MAALQPPLIKASPDQPIELAGTACASVQVDLSDERRTLLTLDLVRALARRAAAEAWAQAGLATQPGNNP